jgi:hypothetical protein
MSGVSYGHPLHPCSDEYKRWVSGVQIEDVGIRGDERHRPERIVGAVAWRTGLDDVSGPRKTSRCRRSYGRADARPTGHLRTRPGRCRVDRTSRWDQVCRSAPYRFTVKLKGWAEALASGLLLREKAHVTWPPAATVTVMLPFLCVV